MARIRTIKPEFWTSEPVVACSHSARLLFVGLWNFCDDGGVHPASSSRLKMEVFPADAMSPADVAKLIAELVAQGLVIEFTGDDGKAYWFVPGFAEHQRIEKPTRRHPQFPGPLVSGNAPAKPEPAPAPSQSLGPKIPRPVAEESTNGCRGLDDGREGKGSGKGILKTGSYSSAQRPRIPLAQHTPAPVAAITRPARPVEPVAKSCGAMVGPVILANRETGNPGKRKRAGAFANLVEADLRSAGRMVAWWQRESRRPKPVVGGAENDLLNVLAAAVRALCVARSKGGNAVAIFARIVSARLWRHITIEQEDRARAMLREWRRGSPGKPANGGGVVSPECSRETRVEASRAIDPESLPGNVESIGEILKRFQLLKGAP